MCVVGEGVATHYPELSAWELFTFQPSLCVCLNMMVGLLWNTFQNNDFSQWNQFITKIIISCWKYFSNRIKSQ